MELKRNCTESSVQKKPSNRYIDGRSKHPMYAIWMSMKYRCMNPKHGSYKDYGARGVGVCKEWSCFNKFVEDMGPRPSMQHTIDRIDNDKGYSKDNCRWATRAQQNKNKRNPFGHIRKHRLRYQLSMFSSKYIMSYLTFEEAEKDRQMYADLFYYFTGVIR